MSPNGCRSTITAEHELEAADTHSHGRLKSEGRIEFRVNSGSVFNGILTKGTSTAITPQHVKFSLDGYRIAASEKDEPGWSVYKPLKGRWYLCLFVNR
jgi:hypothetical protein